MASATPSLLVAYEGDTGLMGFTSTSQGFFMLGSGPNLNNVSLHLHVMLHQTLLQAIRPST